MYLRLWIIVDFLIRVIRVIRVPKIKKAWLLHRHYSSNNKIFLCFFIAKRLKSCNFAHIYPYLEQYSEYNNIK